MTNSSLPATSPTTICLVRHGETDWNYTRRYQGWSDIPLNALGLEQAEVVARAIAGEQWDAIVSSPLARARATAEAIAAALGTDEIEEDPNLRERGYGEAEGLTLEEREAKWAGAEWPGLEPWDVMADRAMAALGRVVERHAGKRVLVVCHGGVINAVLTRTSNGEYGSGITIILNTARTTLRHDGEGWTVETVTDASHLELAVER
ncbi:MAG: histidine phosphatase family protein [Chloroflexota bacterium]|nr:histidine phosphatase family protein [Chloroflexota bacterium]